eukprot:scaffold111278_cov34-Tisochrysis_lutea.AAC.3
MHWGEDRYRGEVAVPSPPGSPPLGHLARRAWWDSGTEKRATLQRCAWRYGRVEHERSIVRRRSLALEHVRPGAKASATITPGFLQSIDYEHADHERIHFILHEVVAMAARRLALMKRVHLRQLDEQRTENKVL